MSWPRIALALLLFGTLAAPAAEPEQKPAEEKKPPEVLAEFKIEKGGRLVFVPVTVKGKEYRFLLDTGAGHCFFDTSLKPKKGLFGDESAHEPETVSVITAGGRVEREISDPPESFLGKLDLREAGQVCWEDGELMRRVIGQDVRGTLGMSFLKRYVVQLDFDSGTLRLFPSDGRDHAEWGTALPLTYRKYGGLDVPFITVRIQQDEEIAVLIDTGASGSVALRPEVFERLVKKEARAESTAATAGGAIRRRTGRLESLAVGIFQHHGLVADEGAMPLLGMEVLSRYVVTFDFPKSKMYLQKGKNFDKVDEEDMSGLHIWVVDKKVSVHSVDKDSPAEAAGIKAEDVILKVADKGATEMDLWDLRDLLKSGDGKEIRMTIKRGEEEKAVSFKLKKRI